MSTLIICTANVCRSPAAEALWRAAATRRGVVQPVASVGLKARAGDRAHPLFVELLGERGLDLTAHQARPFVRLAALRHDLILAMEPGQIRYIHSIAPELSGRVHLMGRWDSGPIADPIGQPRAVFEQCARLLERAVDSWLDKLAVVRTVPMSGRVSDV